ncbi:MAG: hypothetical protein H8E26_03905 [FCB group bacterium]|nr:hypothetical protein [FCB group bacterium]MBL7028280.1 hypothetical protein [Candidatus Neomarinimicrobiota bacterium]MBL7121599.1 hypothetical protein [Candidatus Neomarinimicrobiota bacterium]
MISQIVSLLIFIAISLPANGQDLIQRLIQESEFQLARIELYRHLENADTLAQPKTLAAIAYTYQLENQHLKAKTLYRRVLQKSDLLSHSYVDSIKTNLCFSLIELSEFGSAYGLFSNLENDHIIPVKQRFFILTAERPSELSQVVFNSEELESLERLADDLKSPRKAAILSTIVPGLGQFYASHAVDAAQSFLVVGAGILYSTVAYKAYEQDNLGLGLTSLTIGTTALFHYANILSGQRTAIYRNMKLKQDYLEQSNLDFQPLDLSTSF